MTPMTVDFKNRNSAVAARDPVGQKRERALPAYCVCRERCATNANGRAKVQGTGEKACPFVQRFRCVDAWLKNGENYSVKWEYEMDEENAKAQVNG